ncbi:MAG TPA: hypothetical protein VGR03_15415 [Candidatus Acidoferrum sp.]|nr:hypothetical protein [Candidatus Acidoferrum sp.]
MRGFGLFCCAIVTTSLFCAPVGQAQNVAAPSSPSEAAAGQGGCEVYIALQPIEPTAAARLAALIVPVRRIWRASGMN